MANQIFEEDSDFRMGPMTGSMPYHFPRGVVEGNRPGLRIGAIAFVLFSFAVLIVAFIVMATKPLGG